MESPIVVTGATGNVGSRVAELILAAGEPVRAISRERFRLGPLAAKGADAVPGDLGDPGFLEKALAGARAVFAMIPPKYDAEDFRGYQNRVGDAIAQALRRTGVPRVVTLSSIGAHLPEGTGPILGLRDFEGKLDALGLTGAVHLRPGFFMENHLWSIPVIREHGVNGSPIRPDVRIPMIATKDIAAVAARLLLEGSFAGRAVRHLLGPRDETMSDATRILGAAVGKPDLRYVQVPEEEASKAMAGTGMSASTIEAMLEMHRAFNAGRIRVPEGRNAENTTPTTLDEFARSLFARAYQAAA